MVKFRLSILLAISFSLTIIIAFFLSYRFLQNKFREDMSEFSEKIFSMHYSTISQEIESDFEQIKKITIQTANLIETRLTEKIYTEKEIDEKFNLYLSKQQDGSYRTKVKDSSDHQKVHAFFTNRKSPSLLEKKIIVDGREYFESYAKAVSKNVINTYFTTNNLHWDWDNGSTEWPLTLKADEDFDSYPWYKLAKPASNPRREQVWTPVYYDSVLQEWMTSSLCPVYVEDKFIGVIGHDFLLKKIIDLTKRQKYSHSKIFYVDGSGVIIAHPETNDITQKNAHNNEMLNVHNLKDTCLNRLLSRIRAKKQSGVSIIGQKERSLVFYAPLEVLNWTLVCVVESKMFNPLVSTILGQVVKVLLFIALMTIFVVVVLIHFLANRPLGNLQQAMLKVKQGKPGAIVEHKPYLVELDRLTSIFNSMSETLGAVYGELETSKKQLSDIIDSAPILMILLDEERRLVRINETGTNLFSLRGNRTKGKLVGNVLKCATRTDGTICGNGHVCKGCRLFQLIKDTLKNGTSHSKVKIKFKILEDDKVLKRKLMVSTSAIVDADDKFVLVSIDDITERDKTEKLRQEVELSRRSADLKQQFLANMSHEIRTPMTGIVGMTDFLNETKLTEQQKEFVSIIKSSSESLLYLINDILDISKIEQGHMILQPSTTNVERLFKNVIDIFGPLIRKKGIEFEYKIGKDFPDFINIDGNRFKQVLTNLLSNALKYTEKGSIKIQLNVSQIKNEKVYGKLNVFDTGIGISEEYKERIFEVFYRLENSFTRNTEGTGLGLPIVKKIAELMGGELGVESYKDKGSNFWFSFVADIKDGMFVRTQDKNCDTHISLGMRILLAEDKLVNQKVVTLMLKQADCSVVVANNGLEVLDVFEEDKFDAILMDITMPKMDGITAMKNLRLKYSNLPPIIGLSANALEGDAQKYILLGLDDYITKPVKSETLISRLQKWHLLSR